MKTLYLIRHAKAVSRQLPIADFDRTLSKRGQQDAHTMAQATRLHGSAPDVIVSSPAPRALQTAQIFAKAYRYPLKQLQTHTALYDQADMADAMTVLPLLHALDDAQQTVMLVGHEPLGSACVHFFDADFAAPIPTGAVTCLTFDTSSWSELDRASGTVTWFQTPMTVRTTRQPALRSKPRTKALTFDLPQGWQTEDVSRALHEAYTLEHDKRVQEHTVYYDTFDWRLFNQALTLAATPSQLRLYTLPEERIESQVDMAAAPRRLADLPPGDLHNRLAPILGIRALLPLFELTSCYQPLRIVDDRDKTVLRLTVEQHGLGHHRKACAQVTRLRLHPLKGYDKDVKTLRQWLAHQAFSPSHGTLYELALSAAGKVPNDYATKLRFELDPTQRADEATKQILRPLLEIIRRNEGGIIEDIDTEFLHDFRVAIRRTRSALGQIKGVFPAPVTQRFKTQFAWLGSITNRMRDLDVYLLKEAAYKAELPEDHRDAIDPLFAMLRHERAKAHAALVRQLRTKKYRDILERWDTFLSSPCAVASAARPIRKVAHKRLKKKGNGVVRLGTSLHGSTDEKGLHALRIECKKLRYLLEFFESLYMRDEVAPMVKQLRRLQDNLGDYHDLCVQQADLHRFAERLGHTKRSTPDVLLAIGGLINVLEAEKGRVRGHFPELFAAFVSAYETVSL